MAPAQTAIRRFGNAALVTPAGRIDHAGAGPLDERLAPLCDDPAVAALVLDFGRVEYISSVGLRVLMIAARKLRARGARIAVAALSPVVAEIFAISRFDAVLEIFPAVRDAVGALAPPAIPAYDAAAGAS